MNASASRATYLYCLVANARQPSMRRRLKGLAGSGAVRLLEIPTARARALRRWMVVADVPLDRYGEVAIQTGLGDLDWVSRAAVAHEAVVEAFAAAAAILPMKLFTMFKNDARALDFAAQESRRLDRALTRVLHHEEWGVRVTRLPVPDSVGTTDRARVSGASYLKKKKAQRDRVSNQGKRARAALAELYRDLGRHAKLAVRRTASDLPLADGPLLLDAAFLVPRTKVKVFGAAIRRQASAVASVGCRVSSTGPWPPYSFMQD